MKTLGDIKNAIKAKLEINSTAFDDDIVQAIHAAISLQDRKRWWFTRKTATLTLLANTNTVTLPTDFAASGKVHLVVSNIKRSERDGFYYLAWDRFEQGYGRYFDKPQGTPEACAIYGSQIVFSHKSQQDLPVVLYYFAKDETLPQADNETSIMFDEAFDLIRSLACYIYEKEWLQGAPDNTVPMTYQKRLEEDHERYERGAF